MGENSNNEYDMTITMDDQPVNDYSEELRQLDDLGLCKRRLAEKLLNRFNGDVEKVARRFQGKGLKHQQLQEKWHIEIDQLRSMGYDRPRKAAILLESANGNVADVAAEFTQKQKSRRAQTNQELRAKYQAEVDEIRGRGFERPVITLRLLKKFDGDVDRVINRLSQIESRKHEEHHAKKTVGRKHRVDKMKLKALQNKFAIELGDLETRGFSKQPRRLVLMLERHNGDVEKVVKRLTKRATKMSV